MPLEDIYTHSAIVAKGEVDELSEMELAVLLLSRNDPLGEDETLYKSTAAKVQKMLDLSVADRAGLKCSYARCHTPAVYVIEEGEQTYKACQKDLAFLIRGPATVKLIGSE